MIEEPKHFAELCRQIGVVVLQAQIVEHNLAMYLATSLRLERKAAVEEERNWLVHRLQRESPGAIFSEEAAQPVFQRIGRLDKAILAVLIDLDTVGDRLMDKHGFDSDQIKTKALEKLKEKAIQTASD